MSGPKKIEAIHLKGAEGLLARLEPKVEVREVMSIFGPVHQVFYGNEECGFAPTPVAALNAAVRIAENRIAAFKAKIKEIEDGSSEDRIAD